MSAPNAAGEARARLVQRLGCDVRQHDAGTLGQEPARHRTTDTAGPAGDQRHPPRQRLGLGHALELRLLEQPVLDVERLLLGQADIGVDAGGTAHDVDRVDVELRGDPGRCLVAREGQHADPGHQVDHRVRVAHGRAVRVPAALVVAGIVLPVGFDELVELRVVGVGRQHQRADLGAQEMVGAGGAQRRQLLEPVRVDELQHRGRHVDMADLGLAGADPAAQPRQQAAHDPPPLVLRQRLEPRPAERGRPVVGVEPVLRLLDDAQRGLVAGLAVLPPGEQPVAAEHAAHMMRVGARDRLQLQPQLVARALPGQPADLVAVDLAGQGLRAPRRRDRDHRVRVDMVDVAIGQVGVQRRVDAGGARVEVEGAVRQVAHHLVLVREAAIEALQLVELGHVERREAIALHRAEIATGALDPEHGHLLAGQRIGHRQLGRGVAAAIVGDPLVAAQQVGAVEQPPRLVEAGGVSVVPAILQRLFAAHGQPSRFTRDGLRAADARPSNGTGRAVAASPVVPWRRSMLDQNRPGATVCSAIDRAWERPPPRPWTGVGGAEGATAPETLRQKDRARRPSGERVRQHPTVGDGVRPRPFGVWPLAGNSQVRYRGGRTGRAVVACPCAARPC